MRMLNMVGIGFLGLLVILLILGVCLFIVEGKKSQTMEPELGLKNGQLMLCPNKPNCVNSYAQDELHAIAAIDGDELILQGLVSYLDSTAGFTVNEKAEHYIHATHKSALFGFVDDLELYFDGSVIQVRSASRVGHGDLGANAKRVESLRQIAVGL